MRKLTSYIITLSIFLSCEEASDQSLEIIDQPLLVVDGRLTNERIPQEVRLSLTFDDINEEPPPVTDAIVVINDGTTNFFLTHDDDRPGVYLTDTLQALFGKFYTLFILHDDNEYFAFATSSIGTPLPSLTIQENDGDMFEYIHTETVPSMTEIRVEWSEPNSSGGMDQVAKEAFFYTLDVVDITKTFAPEKEPFTFPRGATIYRKKYSLTEEHQRFLRSFLAEVDWRGGGFDVAAGNVLTNLSEGAIGYFSVSMVISDSNVVE